MIAGWWNTSKGRKRKIKECIPNDCWLVGHQPGQRAVVGVLTGHRFNRRDNLEYTKIKSVFPGYKFSLIILVSLVTGS